MSYDLFVHLKRGAMPTPQAWQEAMRGAGFPVELDLDFDVDQHTGFLPCRVQGETSGFEYFSGGAGDEALEGLDFDFMVQFAVGADPLELLAAAAASSVLASMTHGVLVDHQEGGRSEGETALAWARDLFENPPRAGAVKPGKKPWWRLW